MKNYSLMKGRNRVIEELYLTLQVQTLLQQLKKRDKEEGEEVWQVILQLWI